MTPLDSPRVIVPRVRLALYRLGIITRPEPAAPHFDGPALVTVRLRVIVGRVRDALQAAPDLCHALDRTGVRVYQDSAGLVAVEVPKLAPARLPLAHLAPWQLGLTATGRPAVVDLALESNAVICGATRSGKTTLLQVLALHAARADMRLAIADGKGRRWDSFAGSSALELAIARGPEESAALLKWAADLVEDRLRAGRRGPLLAVFVDEAQTMDSGLLGRIAARCLEAGIRIAAGYQEPRRDQVDPLFARQCANRWTGVLTDPGASSRLIGTPDAKQLGPTGDFLAVLNHAPAVRVTAAYAPATDNAWRILDDGAEPPAIAPAAELDRWTDERARDAELVAAAVQDAARTGRAPSAKVIRAQAKIGMDRARRIRDQAARLLAAPVTRAPIPFPGRPNHPAVGQ